MKPEWKIQLNHTVYGCYQQQLILENEQFTRLATGASLLVAPVYKNVAADEMVVHSLMSSATSDIGLPA